jgi:phage gp16-like protein
MAKYKKQALTAAQRRAAIAKIQIGRQQLFGTDDDSYYGMLESVAGVKSSKDLTDAGLDKVIAHLKKSGCKFTSKSKASGKVPHNLASSPQLQKIQALLTTQGKPFEYALGIARQMYKKQALEFCTPQELRGVIAALVKHGAKNETPA